MERKPLVPAKGFLFGMAKYKGRKELFHKMADFRQMHDCLWRCA